MELAIKCDSCDVLKSMNPLPIIEKQTVITHGCQPTSTGINTIIGAWNECYSGDAPNEANSTASRHSQAKKKPYKLAYGGGLYLDVVSNSSRYWCMKYRFNGKEKRLSFGVYPIISLAIARNEREKAKRILATGGVPGEVKKTGRTF